jgi:hypothetical protein
MTETTQPPLIAIVTRAQAKEIGFTTFYTGEPCKAGHLSPRSVSNGMCTACKREYMARYDAKRREKDPEGFRAAVNDSVKRHYERNKAAILEKKRAYYAANAEAIRTRTQARRAAKKAAAVETAEQPGPTA